MSEKRFKSVIDEDTMSIMPYLVSDKEEECFYNLEGCVDLLNYQDRLIEEQHDEIIKWTKKYVGIKKENEQLKNRLNEEYIKECSIK